MSELKAGVCGIWGESNSGQLPPKLDVWQRVDPNRHTPILHVVRHAENKVCDEQQDSIPARGRGLRAENERCDNPKDRAECLKN